MSWMMIYRVCNRFDLFNAGSNEQYERLYKLMCNGATVRELALAIWICTAEENGETVDSIAEKLKAAMEG